MEKIKVNMSPNPLDVQTIHASQNDAEARQWEFELHNNGELIDTSDVSEQMFFKAYKGGTEQILPENTSTPTTSPFNGDIKYPQGILTDQVFTYRQSPTESDGLAFIEKIKGNTLVWNQQNYDNFTDTSKWLVNDGSKYSVSVSGNVLILTCTGVPDNNASVRISGVNSIVGHKYLLLSDVKSPKTVGFRYLYSPVASGSLDISVSANVWTQFGKVVQINSSSGFYIYFNANRALAQGDVVEIKNHQIIDLTQMFGTTKADEIYAMEQAQSGSGVAYFKSLFLLDYYDYNQGSLLSFNGEQIKTVGKNLLKTNIATETINGVTFTVNKDENGELTEIIVSGTATQRTNFYILPQGTTNVLSTGRYILSCGFDSQNIYMSSYNTSTGLSYRVHGSGVEVPYVTGEDYSIYISVLTGATANNIIFKPMLRLADVEDATFEPYTSSTLSLPISTYFPNGMKSAGSVYDEITETKAITRIGSVDLGSLAWNYNSTNAYFTTNEISSLYKVPSSNLTVANIIDPKHTPTNANDLVNRGELGIAIRSNGTLMVKDTNYTDATAFKTAMNGVMLYYELATESETSFTTASLVTENAEIPLSNEDGVLIGKCTEQLSAEPGFHDAKIKLSDGDGECYSNKIQLHVERKPS